MTIFRDATRREGFFLVHKW